MSRQDSISMGFDEVNEVRVTWFEQNDPEDVDQCFIEISNEVFEDTPLGTACISLDLDDAEKMARWILKRVLERKKQELSRTCDSVIGYLSDRMDSDDKIARQPHATSDVPEKSERD